MVNDLIPIDVRLEDIYLDPNNPRFVGADWTYVPDDEIGSIAVQEKARRHMIDKFAVDKLRMNMEVNGYLPIDRVIVRKFEETKYVVLEGNRRICAAKMSLQGGLNGSTLPNEIMDSFRKIPCLEYVGTEKDAAWILQGLRHITGVIDWSSFNKAKLLVEQMEKEELSLTETGRRFGLSAYGAGQWMRGYYAFKQAREESDYITEVDERAYTYCQELFSRSSAPVREWMGWNESERRFDSILNLNEFIGWIYPRPEDSEEGAEQPLGDWERRIVKSQDDIRQIAYLIREDKEAFEVFRRTKDIERAYGESVARRWEKKARETYDMVEMVFEAIRACIRALDNVPFKLIKDDQGREKLFTGLAELEKAIFVTKQVDSN